MGRSKLIVIDGIYGDTRAHMCNAIRNELLNLNLSVSPVVFSWESGLSHALVATAVGFPTQHTNHTLFHIHLARLYSRLALINEYRHRYNYVIIESWWYGVYATLAAFGLDLAYMDYMFKPITDSVKIEQAFILHNPYFKANTKKAKMNEVLEQLVAGDTGVYGVSIADRRKHGTVIRHYIEIEGEIVSHLGV